MLNHLHKLSGVGEGEGGDTLDEVSVENMRLAWRWFSRVPSRVKLVVAGFAFELGWLSSGVMQDAVADRTIFDTFQASVQIAPPEIDRVGERSIHH